MIAYLKGELTFKNPSFVVVEVGGVGYHVNISLQTYAQIEKMERVKLLTHLHIKEDSHTLYGFADHAERALFVNLISVSGIGPTTAQIMLSALSTDEIRNAIIGENIAAFKQVKGIGPKTAKRLILDLKDKLLKDAPGEALTVVATDNTSREEALSALVALGYNKTMAQKAINRVLRSNKQIDGVEVLIKLTLKELSS
ncbi:MAG: Holliday junction branch migration protein RuvA [Bacteroidota bacterium]